MIRSRQTRALAQGCAVLVCAGLATAQQSSVAFTGATVHPVAGAPIDGGVVIIAGGKIQAIGGADLVIPDGARVVDCKGKIITPGLVDAATTTGVADKDKNEQADEITPHMRIVDAINPASKAFERTRRNGVTTVQISPGNKNVIGGIGAVLKTRGTNVAEMLVRDESCLRMTMGGEPSRGNRAIRGGTPQSIYYRRPTTRMGVVWAVREAFYQAKAYQERKTVGPDAGPQDRDPGMEVLVQALNRKLQVRTTARAEQDIRTALRLANEFGYETVIEEATEAWQVSDMLADAKVKLVFGAPSSTSSADGADLRFHTLSELADKNVPFAIATGSTVGAMSLAHEAMFAVRNGVDPALALRAVTQIPAEILGIGDRVGTLEKGKDADLVIWTGDPFDPTTTVSAVWINGEEATR